MSNKRSRIVSIGPSILPFEAVTIPYMSQSFVRTEPLKLGHNFRMTELFVPKITMTGCIVIHRLFIEQDYEPKEFDILPSKLPLPIECFEGFPFQVEEIVPPKGRLVLYLGNESGAQMRLLLAAKGVMTKFENEE